jgi:hypothetical protein
MPSYDLSLQDQTGVEEAQLQRRMQLAQLLSQGATQGPAYSNKAAVAKVLTQVLGGMDMRAAEQDERNLAQKRTADRQAEIGQIFDAAQGGDAKRYDANGNLVVAAGEKEPEAFVQFASRCRN